MTSPKNLLLNLSLLCGTMLLFFGGIELVLRATGLVKIQDYTPPIYERSENPAISYTLKPNIREKAFRNWVTTDGNGFRKGVMPSSPAPKRAEQASGAGRIEARSNADDTSLDTRFDPSLASARSGSRATRDDILVILGDSITFGYGVADEETLPAQLQKLLPETTVINAGIPGYHIGQEAAFYQEKIAPLDPDALVLVFYWNDFEETTSWLDESGVMRAEGWVPEEKRCEPIERGILGYIPGKCWLDLHSAFYRGIKEYVNTRAAIAERDQRREEEHQDQPSAEREESIPARYEEKLRGLARIAPAQRFFVIWPDAEPHTIARTQLKNMAEREGFVVLDLYDHFGTTMETLTWDYLHPSAASLKGAAAIIGQNIRHAE